MNFDPMIAAAQAQDSARASRLASLNRGAGSEEVARQTAEEFEAFFISHMLETMTVGLKPEDNPFGGGHAETMWQGLMNQEYGKIIAKQGDLGIADQVYDAMIQAQADRTSAERTQNPTFSSQ